MPQTCTCLAVVSTSWQIDEENPPTSCSQRRLHNCVKEISTFVIRYFYGLQQSYKALFVAVRVNILIRSFLINTTKFIVSYKIKCEIFTNFISFSICPIDISIIPTVFYNIPWAKRNIVMAQCWLLLVICTYTELYLNVNSIILFKII